MLSLFTMSFIPMSFTLLRLLRYTLILSVRLPSDCKYDIVAVIYDVLVSESIVCDSDVSESVFSDYVVFDSVVSKFVVSESVVSNSVVSNSVVSDSVVCFSTLSHAVVYSRLELILLIEFVVDRSLSSC